MQNIYIVILVIVLVGTGYYGKKYNIPAYIHTWIKNSHSEIDTDIVKKLFKKMKIILIFLPKKLDNL